MSEREMLEPREKIKSEEPIDCMFVIVRSITHLWVVEPPSNISSVTQKGNICASRARSMSM